MNGLALCLDSLIRFNHIGIVDDFLSVCFHLSSCAYNALTLLFLFSFLLFIEVMCHNEICFSHENVYTINTSASLNATVWP